MRRLLLITPGLYFNPADLSASEKYKWLSKRYCGVVLFVAHKKELRHLTIHNFEVCGINLPRFVIKSRMLRNVCYAVFVLTKSIALHNKRRSRFDVIVAHNAYQAGVLGWIISKCTGARLITEISGNYDKAFRINNKEETLVDRIKHAIAMWITPFVLNRSHGVKLLNPEQVRPFKNHLHNSEKYVCFHNIVPISAFRHGMNKKYILLIGHPWFLKGVDILIEAYNMISAEYPAYRLKIFGYCQDRTYFERLANGSPRIELCGPVPHDTVIDLMANCAVFVLPSRTEAMGRVLLEAMASKKPIIASRVDGIPTYIKNDYNGLLFKPGSADDLAEKLRIILRDEDYAKRLAECGYRYVHTELSEEVYLNKFTKLVEDVLKR